MIFNRNKIFKISILTAVLMTAVLLPSSFSYAGEKAPDFTLFDLEGKSVSLSDYKGSVVLLNFWATWCPPCRQEIPHFIELYDELKDLGFVVIGISVDKQGPGVVNKWVRSKNVNYPVLLSDEQTSADYQQILSPEDRNGIPFTFIIDKEGNVTQTAVGYRDKDVWKSMILPLMK